MESFQVERFDGLTTGALLSTAEEVSTEDSEERWGLVQELQRRVEPEVFRTASAWCSSSEAHLRRLGADVLGQLGYEKSHPFAEDSTPVLLGLLRDEEADVVADALIALGHLGRGSSNIIARLASHDNARIRYAVAACLGPRTDDDAIRALLGLMEDDDRDVRDWATFGLGDMGQADSSEIRAALAQRLRDDDEEIRGEAMVGLANRGEPEVVPAILEELRQTGSVLAVRAAGILGDPVFVPELRRLVAGNPAELDIREALDRCSTH